MEIKAKSLCGKRVRMRLIVTFFSTIASVFWGTPVIAEELKSADAFSHIRDKEQRSLALFGEMSKVIQHPRCMNCHPTSNSPYQGMTMRLHEPPVTRGEDNHGVPGMQCQTCHQDSNTTITAQAESIKSIPGHPKWHLAPVEMGWVGKSLGEICRQIKDPTRNGNMDDEALIHHMTKDTLVGWAWAPGEGRESAPGSQQIQGNLTRAWLQSGAACPSS